MDEKDMKSLTIGDILDQLAKPPKLQGPENPSPRPAIPAPYTQPKDLSISPALPVSGSPQIRDVPLSTAPLKAQSPAPQQKPQLPNGGKLSSGINLPHIGKETDGTEISESQSGLVQPQEVRLYIRTMSADLEKLKRGQKPSDPEIISVTPSPLPKAPPLKTMPLPPLFSPSPQPPPLPSPLSSPRPSPLPLTPPPSLTRPVMPPSLPPQPLPSLNTPPTLPIKEELHHHKERRISEAELLPEFLGALVPKRVAKTKKEKVQYGLIARIIGSGMTVGIISTVLIATISYLLLYFLVFNREEVVVPTPIPSSSGIIPTPIINELETIFKAISTISFKIPENKAVVLSEFKAFIGSQTLAKKEFKVINFTDPTNMATNPNFTELLDIFSIQYPVELKGVINDRNMTFIYGQEELFNGSTNEVMPRKLVFIVEIKDVNVTLGIMKNWELTMPGTFKDIFDIDPIKEASLTFLDNERRGIKVRYKNFPLPDKSIDYSVVSSLTGRHYLILTNSRESMYSPTDKLLGL